MSPRELDYAGRRFRSLENSDGGDVDASTLFDYHQDGRTVWATYTGGAVRLGTLIALAADDGSLEMRYQHLAADGTFKTGECSSTPELLPDGRLRLHERWRWTSGGEGSGNSVLEEIPRTTGTPDGTG